jgi:hypothetical protein
LVEREKVHAKGDENEFVKMDPANPC